jgi:quinol monooxygenase YgiN
MAWRWPLALFCLSMVDASAQAPAGAPVAADVSPLHVVTYLELRPTAQSEGAALLRSWQEAQRRAPGNLRAELVRSPARPGQFVVIAAWRDKAAFDAHAAAAEPFREKLQALRDSPADDRFHSAFSTGKLDTPRGALYVVTHVDVVPPRREDAQAALKLLAEANRGAEGNLRFEVLQQTNRLNHFTLVETWRSRQAFEANSMSAHQREFRDKLAQMAGALYDERLYESLD